MSIFSLVFACYRLFALGKHSNEWKELLLFVVYLTTQSVTQNVLRCITGMINELETTLKKVVMA
jgi:hypothetical protein